MKVINTPTEIKKVIGEGFYKFPKQIVEHLFEEVFNHPMFPHTYTDSNVTVVLYPEDIPTGKELLILELENKMSTFSNSFEKATFSPAEYVSRSFVLKADKKALFSDAVMPAGTLLYCVGKIYCTPHQTTNTYGLLVLTDGKNTVLCTEKEIRTTIRKRHINSDVFTECTSQYVFTRTSRPSLIEKTPVYSGTRMYCVTSIFINGTRYYIAANNKDAILCQRNDFCTYEELKNSQLATN
jgi:hypothetical protein